MTPIVDELLAEPGGVAPCGALAAVVGRGAIEAALAGGGIVRDSRGVHAPYDEA